MRASDEAINKLLESLAPEILRPHEFELQLGELVGRFRREARLSREAQAAKRLHEGATELARQWGCHRVTVYRLAKRGKKIVASQSADATPA